MSVYREALVLKKKNPSTRRLDGMIMMILMTLHEVFIRSLGYGKMYGIA